MSRVIPPGTVLLPESPEAEPDAASRPKTRQKRRQASSGRFESINIFVDEVMAGLSRAEALVWLALWRDTRNGRACTSYLRLAHRLGANRATVYRAIKRLKAKGLIRVVRKGGIGRGPSVYQITATEHGCTGATMGSCKSRTLPAAPVQPIHNIQTVRAC